MNGTPSRCTWRAGEPHGHERHDLRGRRPGHHVAGDDAEGVLAAVEEGGNVVGLVTGVLNPACDPRADAAVVRRRGAPVDLENGAARGSDVGPRLAGTERERDR